MSAVKLILASGSPRRRDLMTEAGYDFEVISPEVEEIADESIPVAELSLENAKLKAAAVAKHHPERVVIAADTLVAIDQRSLGKPVDMDEAFAMISTLNGRPHEVMTAVCVQRGEDIEAFTVSTSVFFKSLTDDELREYQAKIEPLDKAGSYAVQDHGTMIIDRLEGSLTNVIGLPMDELGALLKRWS